MTRHLGDGWLLPGLDDYTRPWFQSGQLSVQACADCGALQHPPDEVCAGCQGTRLEWRACGPNGRIESVAVVHQAVHPLLRDALPYTVVVVSLDDAPGVNAIGNILNRAPGQVSIGQRVRAVFEEVPHPDGGEPYRIPQWEVV